MKRWGVAVAALLCSVGCKSVHSTAGADGGDDGVTAVGFLAQTTRVDESVGQLLLPVNLTGAVEFPVTVSYRAVDGNAEGGNDYAIEGSQVTFAPGQTTQTIPVTILPDGIDEPDESFRIELVSATGVTVDTRIHTVVIATNTTPIVNFEIDTSIANEDVAVWIAMVLDEPSSQPVTVSYQVGGTAATADYQPLVGSVTFSPGSIRELIALVPVDDVTDEADELVVFNVTQVSNGILGPFASHTHTIRDNDAAAAVRFVQTAPTAGEGNTGTTTAFLDVVVSPASGKAITVPFTVEPSSTADGLDYTVMTPSPLSIPPGAVGATIAITIRGDNVLEGSETVSIQLGTPTNATLGLTPRATVRIANDDCLGTGTFTICPDAPLTDSLVLPADLITDTSPVCSAVSWGQSGQPASCIVFARSITVDSTRAWGARPLVLVATETITITNVLDASARRGYGGPASNAPFCNPPVVMPGPRAGAPGGSFVTAGGNGGAHTNPVGVAGQAGAAETSAPTLLRGGCPGFVGGENFSSYTYGDGGGAVYLVAGTSITLAAGAIINASGDGAAAGVDISNGGSGGGSGGMIVLHAPAIQAASAFVVANGGGGAQGGDLMKYGSDGGKPNPTTPFVAAPGGSGNGGGNGGAGFAAGSMATNGASATNNSGAGGGGGGAGYIKTNQPLTGASVSPPPS